MAEAYRCDKCDHFFAGSIPASRQRVKVSYNPTGTCLREFAVNIRVTKATTETQPDL